MAEKITAWRCVGCGRVEAPQPCIGVCQDRQIQLVPVEDYDAIAAVLARLESETAILRAVVRDIATITPRADAAERTYGALQSRAREALGRVKK
jgi:hypothetical protein